MLYIGGHDESNFNNFINMFFWNSYFRKVFENIMYDKIFALFVVGVIVALACTLYLNNGFHNQMANNTILLCVISLLLFFSKLTGGK